MNGVVNLLRRTKHYSWLGLRGVRGAMQLSVDAARKTIDRLVPYEFSTSTLVDIHWSSFVRWDSVEFPQAEGVPRQIFCFWTGQNTMSLARARALEIFRKMQHLPIELVAAEELHSFIRTDHPLHPAYEFLSENHRSDYLRAYFLHYYGGGYSDIKASTADWGTAFDAFADKDVWLVGYRERSSREAAYINDPVGRAIRRHFSLVIGHGAMIARPQTPLTAEWLAEIERRLNYYLPVLRERPAIDPFGDRGEYPVPWTMIGSQVLQPLQLKYLSHVRQEDCVLPILRGHR